MATIIPTTTAAGFSAALAVDMIVMIEAGSVAASTVDSAEMLSVAVAADSMAVVADSMAVVADSTAVAADSTAVAADSMAVAVDSMAVAADTDNSHESLIRSVFGAAAARGGAGAFGLYRAR